MKLSEIAQELSVAEAQRQPIPPLVQTSPELTVADAYEIQRLGIAARCATGARVWGRKVGLTSLAMQRALRVDEPDFGIVLNDMVLDSHKPFPIDTAIQPRIEAEIAIVLGADLKGPRVTRSDVIAATVGVLPALELIDSRIENWQIGLIDTVADNASSCRVLVGSRLTPLSEVDLRLVGVAVTANGRLAAGGAGAAVLDDPLNCVAWLANRLAGFGEHLTAGEVILSGALHRAFDVSVGDVIRADFAHIGAVTLRFEGGSQ
jgi:2-keto-4-pentenoate hydratase